MTAWLRERGVAPDDILVDAGGSRTRETMNRAAGVFDIHDAVICTQDVNVARSVYLAEQAGIDAVAVGVPSTLGTSARYMRDEALKTTLAFFESLFQRRQSPPSTDRLHDDAVADSLTRQPQRYPPRRRSDDLALGMARRKHGMSS